MGGLILGKSQAWEIHLNSEETDQMHETEKVTSHVALRIENWIIEI